MAKILNLAAPLLHQSFYFRSVMMRRLFVSILLILIIYFTWAYFGRGVNHPYSYGTISKQELNRFQGGPNVVAVQARMTTWDYAGAESFQSKLEYYLQAAKDEGWLRDKTIVVFPEHIGTWLVASGEKEFVYASKTIEEASQKVILTNLLPYAQIYFQSNEKDKERASLFKMKSNSMLRAYQYTFSKLAREYNVTIIAGSIILPEPKVEDGIISLSPGSLKNVTAVFHPDGRAHEQLYFKQALDLQEEGFISSSVASSTLETNGFRFGILTCTDSWRSEMYSELQNDNVSMVVVPACAIGNERWSSIWDSETGPGTDNVAPGDSDEMTYEDAWHKLSIAQAPEFGIRYAVAVLLRGQLWDLDSQGGTFAVINNRMIIPNDISDQQGAIFNIWLPVQP